MTILVVMILFLVSIMVYINLKDLYTKKEIERRSKAREEWYIKTKREWDNR